MAKEKACTSVTLSFLSEEDEEAFGAGLLVVLVFSGLSARVLTLVGLSHVPLVSSLSACFRLELDAVGAVRSRRDEERAATVLVVVVVEAGGEGGSSSDSRLFLRKLEAVGADRSRWG